MKITRVAAWFVLALALCFVGVAAVAGGTKVGCGVHVLKENASASNRASVRVLIDELPPRGTIRVHARVPDQATAEVRVRAQTTATAAVLGHAICTGVTTAGGEVVLRPWGKAPTIDIVSASAVRLAIVRGDEEISVELLDPVRVQGMSIPW